MSKDKELCPACGHKHPVNTRPIICHNLLELAAALREPMLDDTTENREQLLSTLEDIMGLPDDEEDDDEVFRS